MGLVRKEEIRRNLLVPYEIFSIIRLSVYAAALAHMATSVGSNADNGILGGLRSKRTLYSSDKA